MFCTVVSTARPVRSILAFFTLWKLLLLVVSALAAAAPDYDTSTSLFFRLQVDDDSRLPLAASLAQRLTRWDAIYYIKSAKDGYTYEQEWAFGPGMPTLVSGLVGFLPAWAIKALGPSLEPLVATCVSHVSHLIAALALFRLTMRVCKDPRFAMTASLLHVVSPAGLFLSAPYAESPFACLTQLGNLLFASSYGQGWIGDLSLVGAGVLFGVSILFRSNGLLSGMLFAVEALSLLLQLIRVFRFSGARRLLAVLLGGICVAAGSLVPQYIAWVQYCTGSVSRPWCSQTLPSIYTFVQETYWNVGFLRYWTVEQLPLFILATPMLSLLLLSGLKTLRQASTSIVTQTGLLYDQQQLFLRTLAAMQTVLAVLAITNYHVQIITRISTAYPVWYWYIARLLSDKTTVSYGSSIVMFMVMYAIIQCGLYSSFLPPA